jgi:hypothetical protein
MSSLTAHLRRPDDHARLPFHPECPLCRAERLAGSPPDDAFISRRSQALLAASVLAVASASPTAVLAAEPEQEQEGAAAPEQLATEETLSAADFDSSGQPTDLALDVGTAVEDDSLDQATVVEGQESTGEEDPAAATDPSTAGAPDEPPATDPPPPPAPEPQIVPAPASPVEQAPEATQELPQAEGGVPGPEQSEETVRRAKRPPRSAMLDVVPTPTTVVTPTQLPALRANPAVTSHSTTIRVATTHRRAIRRADRFHVVQRGESLWSIAKDLLGDDASVARIAREVNRLWELNSARIGTGEPDLLITGTRIALR